MIPGPGSTSEGPFEVVRSGSSRAAYRCPGAAQSGYVRVARGSLALRKSWESGLRAAKPLIFLTIY